MAVIGGMALSAWKHPRATRDIDILIGIEDTDIDRVLEVLRLAGVRAKRHPPIVTLGDSELIQLLYEPPDAYVDLQIDLLLAKSEHLRNALARRVPLTLPGLGIEVAVVACEDLILLKLAAGRIIDRADAIALLKANRRSLDIDYLSGSAAKLGLSPDLAEVWQQAFPGERAPGG
jgi:hypothetical protein